MVEVRKGTLTTATARAVHTLNQSGVEATPEQKEAVKKPELATDKKVSAKKAEPKMPK